MNGKTRLELTWIGKEDRPRLEPRILIEDAEKSCHAKTRGPKDIFDNMLIHGDNLLALKALEQDYTGKVKCVFIDPPYNTGSAFEHYDDGIEHSLWLSLMRDRLEIIRKLMSDDGSLWITIDDNECHYLKVLCDEVFGRASFVTSFIWKKVDSPNDNKVPITPDHEYVLCFSKVPGAGKFKQRQDSSILDAYRPPDTESARAYRDRLLKKNGKNSLRSDRPSMFFPIEAPDGSIVLPIHDDGREACWALGKRAVDELIARKELVWKLRENNGAKKWVPYTREFAPDNPTRPYPTIWNDLDTTRQTKAHQKELFGENGVFATPKPEDLVSRVMDICTEQGELVLDSFAGSGTTGAVAHKMNRRWIMVELGDHCDTHIVPRLRKVIDGEDKGGITEAVDWKGGGGFRYYHLAPSLIEVDRWGNRIISKKYNAAMLAEAVCKHLGFTYAPSSDPKEYWKHGHSSEQDFIYVTTTSLTVAALRGISEDVGPGRTLLICCKAFDAKAGSFDNLTAKKIPQAVLANCEWGRDDYSLHIAKLPVREEEPGAEDAVAPIKGGKAKKKPRNTTPSLFDRED